MTSQSFDLSMGGANVENLKTYVAKNYMLIGNNLNNTIIAAAGRGRHHRRPGR